jgi:PKD repeat protein
MKKNTMIGLIAIVAIAVVILAGCVEEETPIYTPTPAVTPTTTLTPTPASPMAKVSATQTRANVGENVSFGGADSTDPDGTIVSYKWDFGDGTTELGTTVTHAYSNERTYTVKLTVTDNDGLSGTDTIKITVTTPRYTLSEAIDKNFVKAEMTGSGASSGEPVTKIVLDSSEPLTFILEAYCLDFHKLDASDNLSLDITSVGAIQTAIWVVTEDISKKELVDRFPVEQKDIDNAKVVLEEAGIDTTSKRLFR